MVNKVEKFIVTPEQAAKKLRGMGISERYWLKFMSIDPSESGGLHPIKTYITIAQGTEPMDFVEVYKQFSGTLDRTNLDWLINESKAFREN